MTLYDLFFYLFALIILISAVIVVSSRHIVRSAFALLFTLFGVAGIYVMLNADFLAIVQLIVYIGGILILIIFGVMLTNKAVNVQIKTKAMNVLPATIAVGIFAGVLTATLAKNKWFVTTPFLRDTTIKDIGKLLLTNYMIPFQVAGILLLIALIGAVMIARYNNKEEK